MAKEDEPVQSEEKSIRGIIDEKLDEVASRIVKCATDLCVIGIEKLTPAKSPQAECQQL
jgi:hypothetical protein